MEYFYRIIGSAATWRRFVRDQTRVTETAHINMVPLVIIIAPEFTGILTDAIYGDGLNDGLLRTMLSGRCRAKHGNTAGPVHFVYFFFPGNIQYVQQPLHVQMPGKVGI